MKRTTIVALGLLVLQAVPSGYGQAPGEQRSLSVEVGKGTVVDIDTDIRRVAISDSEVAEAIVSSPREVLINGKKPGETSMIVWPERGPRLFYTVTVLTSASRLQAVRTQLKSELPGQNILVDFQNDVPILQGVAKDLTSAERAVMLASTLGRPMNLLKVEVPATAPQILVKIKFANVDKLASRSLGTNIFSTGTANTIGGVTTQQFAPPHPDVKDDGPRFTFSDALNIFLFRPDLNLGATIRALENRNLLQILAEPNLMTLNEQPASFLAGGEFPFPTLQGGGAGLGAVTIQFREFGIRLNFTPSVTPRGTIRLSITPEVSSLDYANALVVQGHTIPALSTRRVSTEIELSNGQSFAIAGLLDNRVTQSLTKIPGLGDIPVLGKLFHSRQTSRNQTELLVVVTPEILSPIQAGQPVPEVHMPEEFMLRNTNAEMRTPPETVTGTTPPHKAEPIAIEELQRSTPRAPQPQPPTQFVLPPGLGPIAPSPATTNPGNR